MTFMICSEYSIELIMQRIIHLESKSHDFSKKKWLILWLGQRKYKMSLDHVAVLEVKKVPVHTHTHTYSCNHGNMPKGHRSF